MRDRQIADWLRHAFGSDHGCPSPEAYLKDSLHRMSPTDREKIQAHASRCPACAAERDLARAFDMDPEQTDASPEDVAFVVSHLQGSAAESTVVVGLDAARRRKTPWRVPRTWFAAAAVLLVGALGVVLTLWSPAPMLPPRGEDAILRGGWIEAREPLGELDAMPRTFRWDAVAGADRYRVRLMKGDDTLLYECVVEDASAEIPPAVRDEMYSAVVYFWLVEAIDAEGNRISGSDRVRFRVKPGASQETR